MSTKGKQDKKRKKEINSRGSISELETDSIAPELSKKQSSSESAASIGISSGEENTHKSEIADIKKQLKDKIENSKLTNIVSNVDKPINKMNNKVKDIIGRDNERLKNLVNDLLDKLKESLLTSCTKQIKILEARLSEKEIENDTLKKDVKNLKSQVNIHSEENTKLKTELANQENNRRRSENDSNQYSRSNNIILSGTEHSSTKIDPKGMPLFESAEEATKISIAKITSITKESQPSYGRR
ncbi:hypothetical protein DPMN_061858 [Dreissena polymorpha]|uniref:Uncharacterized protein n=1 Tax=Dreissena polymorpha TaxID=45954 RepID=A0A9D4HH99_DREPO|nr:hypothetical protein DPMN_061858 [Dreissena polymorpha]